MSAPRKTFAFGTLGESGDTWFLLTEGHMTLLDAPFAIDLSLEKKEVSVIGEMGIPASAPGITKLLVHALVSHERIAQRTGAPRYSRRAPTPHLVRYRTDLPQHNGYCS
jgi:hypothetical protein